MEGRLTGENKGFELLRGRDDLERVGVELRGSTEGGLELTGVIST